MEVADGNPHPAARLQCPSIRPFYNSDAVLEHARLEAIKAGITFISACGRDAKVFENYGGDMIFLLRNLAHSVGLDGVSDTEVISLETGNVAASHQAAESFVDLLKCWMADYAQPSSEMEMEEILNIVEALHTVDQLGIKTNAFLPKPTEVLARLTAIEHPIVR